MDNPIWNGFLGFITGSYSFPEMYSGIAGLLSDVWANEHIRNWWGGLWNVLQYIEVAIPFFLLVFWLVVSLVGKRIFSVLRFTAFTIAGFMAGVCWLSPFVLMVIPMLPTWVIGLVTGVVAGVLSKLLYILLYAFVPGYAVYVLFCGGIIVPLEDNYVVAAVVAVVVIVLVFIFRKYIEMLGTSMLGCFGIACVIRGWHDYGSWPAFVGIEWLPVLILTLLLAAGAFVVQYKTRVRY